MKNNTVVCQVEYTELENERMMMIPSVEVTCPVCEESEISFGEGDASIRRCLANLKDQCGCDNFLIAE